MASVNDEILSESIRHQVALQGYTNNVLNRILAILNRADARLAAELHVALEGMTATTFTMERLESLLYSSGILRESLATYNEMGAKLGDDLREFMAYELSYQHQMLVSHLPVQVHVATVTAETAYAAAMARPFQGVLLKNVWSEYSDAKMKLVRQTIALGYDEGKTTEAIIRELRGTRAEGYTDGKLEAPRREVATVVRTALGHTAGFAQDRVMNANADLIKAVRWSSHLDSRTSSGCRIRDGLLYQPITHKPIGHEKPWRSGPGRLHYNCRSGQVPITKSFRELGIDLPDTEAGNRERASMDGAVPESTTYADWIKKQSRARQEEILGVAKTRLIREGKMDFPSLYNDRGVPLTLEQLRKRDAEAFKRAGL